LHGLWKRGYRIWYTSPSAETPELRFSDLLAENGAERLELVRVQMKRATKDLEANARRFREMWYEVDNSLKNFEQWAKKDPKARAEEVMRKVAYESNLYG
jgi:hypothetical protein